MAFRRGMRRRGAAKRSRPRRRTTGRRPTGGRRSLRKRNPQAKLIAEMKRLTEPISYIYNWGMRYLNDQGASINTGCMSMIVPFLQWNDASDLVIMHNKLQLALAGPTPAGGTYKPPLSKFAVGSYKGQFSIKNVTNIETSLDLYTCVMRSDTDQALTPSQRWGGNSLTQIYFSNALPLLIQSLQEQSGGISAYGSSITLANWPVGVTPFDCHKFCAYVKIIKVKKNVFFPGAGFKRFTVEDKKWRIYDGTKIAGTMNSNASMVSFARKTKFVFGIFTAQQVSTGSSNMTTNFAPNNVLVGGAERYLYTGINNATKYFDFASDVNQGINSANLMEMNIMTETTAGYTVV